MENASESTSRPRRVLSLFDAVCIIVGTIIGAGIFKTAPEIAKLSGSFPALTSLWIFGGFLTIVGALCFAELTTNNQNVLGGDYGFLKLAFGRPLAFMFAWATFWIIRPGNIGAMALVFALYFDQVFPFTADHLLGPNARQLGYAVIAVIVLSAANLTGLRQGKWLQNILTVAKVVGMLAIVVLAFFKSRETAEVPDVQSNLAGGSWVLAMVFIMFSYGGWNDLSFISNEIKKPEKNLFRSLICGALIVTGVYLVVNFAFVAVLGFTKMANSQAVATDVVWAALGRESLIGRKAAQIIAGLICISCLGAINGIIITSPRIYFAAGRDFELIKGLGSWDLRLNQPALATVLQAGVTIGLFCFCFRYDNPFDVIVVVSAPFFWTFLGLTGISLIVLRGRQKGKNRMDTSHGYQVPFYPLPPLILAVTCFSMAWASMNHVIRMEFWTAAIAVNVLMVVGVLLGLVLKPRVTDV